MERYVIGVDGWSKGWIAVSLRDEQVAVEVYRSISDLFAKASEAQVIAIDIPIGLQDSVGRPADAAARKILAKQANRVFSVFPRSVYQAGTYDAAKDRCAGPPLISRQAYGLGRAGQTLALSRIDARQ